MNRRTALRLLGQSTLAVTVLAACSDGTAPVSAVLTSADTSTTTPPPSSGPDATPSTATSTTAEAPPQPADGEAITWQRVFLDFVSAYVLVRGTEAAIVDTGVAGSETAIEAGLAEAGLGWDAVGHVVLTHLHDDHVGSLGAVMEATPDATGYAGADDLDRIRSPRPLTALADGDTVFGLEIIATPGHTAGHVSVFDPVGRILVAGDAINGGGNGTVLGPNPDFTRDIAEANRSVSRLAGFDIDTILFGHGSPVEGGAGAKLTELAAAL